MEILYKSLLRKRSFEDHRVCKVQKSPSFTICTHKVPEHRSLLLGY